MNEFKKNIFKTRTESVVTPPPTFTNKVTSLTAASYLDVNYFINLNLTLQYSVLVNTIFNIKIDTDGGVFTSFVYISAGNIVGSDNIDTGSTNDPSPINNICITSSDNSDIDISMFVCLQQHCNWSQQCSRYNNTIAGKSFKILEYYKTYTEYTALGEPIALQTIFTNIYITGTCLQPD